jgi:hypothetical protein
MPKDSSEELKRQNKELSERIAKLEEAAKPPKPSEPWTWQKPDPTEGMSMPRSAMQAMIDAVPESLMRELRSDARRPNPVTGGPAPPPTPQGPRGSGWREAAPIAPPPGIEQCDRLVAAQDRIDQIELARKLAAAEVALKAAKESGG